MREKPEGKWVYEVIAENIPPFSLLPKRYNVLTQLMFLESIGILAVFYFNLPVRALIFGSLGVFIAGLWSLTTLEIAPMIRHCKCPLSKSEDAFVEWYTRTIFHSKHLELIPGGLVFIIMLSYIFYFHDSFGTPYLIQYWIGERVPPFIIFLFVLLSWDLAYRMGIGLWVSGLALWRSVKITKLSKERIGLEYIPYSSLKAFQNLDTNNIYFGLIAFLLLPTILQDGILIILTITYACFIVVVSLISKFLILKIPWAPPYIYDLLNEGKFAYVGTSDKRMTPHVTPVIYVFDGRSIYFVTSVVSKKLKNIKENTRISFLIPIRDTEDLLKNRAVLFIGRVKVYSLLDIPLRFLSMFKARKLFFRKYPRYMMRYSEERKNLPRAWQMTPIISRILVKVKPEEVIYWWSAKPIRLPM